MTKSSIEWTEHTWNPIVGCSIVSPGCTNCYAMAMAARIEAMGNQPRYAGTTRKVNGHIVWTGKLAQAPEATLLAPLRRKIPTTYFVNSMGDLFHEDCPDEWIDRVFAVMALCSQHTFQVLTKRAARMREYCTRLHDEPLRDTLKRICVAWPGNAPIPNEINIPLPNVWFGVSTERQQEADERIPLLLQTPAAVRFISAEPLLGQLDLTRLCVLPQKPGSIRAGIHIDALRGRYCESGVAYKGDWDIRGSAPSDSERRKLDWIICGGESGPKARPMHPDWARSLRDQCAAAGVAFFFKQWGDHWPAEYHSTGPDGEIWRTSAKGQPTWFFDELKAPRPNEVIFSRVGKKLAGRLLDGIEHNAMPSQAADRGGLAL